MAAELSPVVIHLVDNQDLMADLLLVEKFVHEWNEHQQLFEAFSEGDHECQLVRTPAGVVRCGCLSLSGTGWRRRLGIVSVLMRYWGHVTRTAELQPQQRDEDQHHAEAKQLVDGAFPRQKPGKSRTRGHKSFLWVCLFNTWSKVILKKVKFTQNQICI